MFVNTNMPSGGPPATLGMAPYILATSPAGSSGAGGGGNLVTKAIITEGFEQGSANEFANSNKAIPGVVNQYMDLVIYNGFTIKIVRLNIRGDLSD